MLCARKAEGKELREEPFVFIRNHHTQLGGKRGKLLPAREAEKPPRRPRVSLKAPNCHVVSWEGKK